MPKTYHTWRVLYTKQPTHDQKSCWAQTIPPCRFFNSWAAWVELGGIVECYKPYNIQPYFSVNASKNWCRESTSKTCICDCPIALWNWNLKASVTTTIQAPNHASCVTVKVTKSTTEVDVQTFYLPQDRLDGTRMAPIAVIVSGVLNELSV